jgi:hypothetical protein
MKRIPALVLEKLETRKEPKPNEINEESLERHAKPRGYYNRMSEQHVQRLRMQSIIK